MKRIRQMIEQEQEDFMFKAVDEQKIQQLQKRVKDKIADSQLRPGLTDPDALKQKGREFQDRFGVFNNQLVEANREFLDSQKKFTQMKLMHRYLVEGEGAGLR